MTISFINSANNSNATASTSFTFTKPTNAAAGDVLVGFVVHTSSTTFTNSTSVTGWNLVADYATANDGAGNDSSFSAISVYTITLDASAPASWTGTSTSASYIACVHCYRGATEAGILVSGTPTTQGSGSTTFVGPTVANNIDPDAWKVGCQTFSDGTGKTFTDNATERSDQDVGIGADDAGLTTADGGPIAVGTAGAVTWTGSASTIDGRQAWMMVLPSARYPEYIYSTAVHRSYYW